MPLYEYRCRKCSRRFEALLFGTERPSCPKCRGHDLEKLHSAFAVSGAERKSESDSLDDFGTGPDSGGEPDPGDSGYGGDYDAPEADATDD